MAENNQIAKAPSPDFRSIVQKTADAYIPLVAQQLSGSGINADNYQKQCMSNALVAINEVAVSAGEKSLEAFNKVEVMEILQQVASLRLNAFSQPRECYFQTRKKKLSDGSWGISIEMGVEGDGNDAILRNFGHDVEKVYPYWAVREDDEFSYPSYHGIEVEPVSYTHLDVYKRQGIYRLKKQPGKLPRAPHQ